MGEQSTQKQEIAVELARALHHAMMRRPPRAHMCLVPRRDEGDSVRTRAIDAAPFVVRAVREETMSVLGVRLTCGSGGIGAAAAGLSPTELAETGRAAAAASVDRCPLLLAVRVARGR